MGKWLKFMFWLTIAGLVFNFMGLDFVKKAFPALGIVGAIGDFLVAILSGYCLWQLRDLTDRYRIAGLGLMGLTVFNVFYELLQTNSSLRVIGFVFGVIAVGFGIVCKYNEIHAHSEMLAGIHDELAQKWLKLWKWIVALYAAIFGSIVLIFIPFLAAIVLLVSAVCSIVVSVYEMVYLYYTYKVCEDHLVNQ